MTEKTTVFPHTTQFIDLVVGACKIGIHIYVAFVAKFVHIPVRASPQELLVLQVQFGAADLVMAALAG